ncbi:Dihydrofolate synthetase [Paramicrosporidium saccamoebae]|uniref:Dihydrofolate synthetase n=1 Tax=Paramicrosporidium saccamoebae TaxID=1246581 RepID=A0A2H9TM79_9FUNG|nr:Dihydrofolate synthetase [Paramicrosporidium saccamoebae]
MTITFSLEKPLRLAHHLQNPQNDLPNYIHVGGINGKTTVALLLTRLLCTGSRLRIGTFVHSSPPQSGILLNETPVDSSHYAELWRHVSKMDEIFSTACTVYEKTVLVALLLFREWQCDVVVLEAALGGTFDATNLLAHAQGRQLAAVVTNIAEDHTRLLGTGVECIVANIVGIVRPAASVVVAASQSEAVQTCLSRMDLTIASSDYQSGHLSDQLTAKDFVLPIPGHQIEDNVDLALRTYQLVSPLLEQINGAPLRRPSLGTFVSLALPHVFKEFYYQNRRIILDAAQNSGSTLCTWLRNSVSAENVHLVLGMSDKGTHLLENMLRSLGTGRFRFSFVNFKPSDDYPWIHPADRHELCRILYNQHGQNPTVTNHTELVDVLTDMREELLVIFGSPHIIRDFYLLCQERGSDKGFK